MELQVNVKDRILKSASEVFNSIINANKMSGYFISEASGNMKAGETITWSFKDAGVSFNVKVTEVVPDQKIVFTWSAGGSLVLVTIELNIIDAETTGIVINEDGYEMSKEGVSRLMQQTQGWTDFVCSLKAFLYTGINLRKGRSKASY